MHLLTEGERHYIQWKITKTKLFLALVVGLGINGVVNCNYRSLLVILSLTSSKIKSDRRGGSESTYAVLNLF